MNLLVILALAALSSQEICSGEHLTLRGVGTTAARFAQPYANCINSKHVVAEQILKTCSERREAQRRAALESAPDKHTRANIERAFRWLDAMAAERANCEAHLEIQG